MSIKVQVNINQPHVPKVDNYKANILSKSLLHFAVGLADPNYGCKYLLLTDTLPIF